MKPIKKLVRKLIPVQVVKGLEKSYRLSRGVFWQTRFGFPARGMRVIAVTGTNGKTTTVSYINEILKSAGYKTAALTTVYYEVDGQKIPNETHLTIHKQSIAQSFLSKAKKADVDFVVFEVTSHALDQDRIMGVPVEIGVMTNLTQEHLDYHKTMDNYAAAKSSLFKNYGAKHAVLNLDDEWYTFFAEESKAEIFTYGKNKDADLKISDVKLADKESSAVFSFTGGKIKAKTGLLGEFNLYNAAAASGVGTLLNIDPGKIEKGLSSLSQLSGRMEEIDEGRDFKVIIDFAITPDAIEKALEALRGITKGKIRIVFGATGDRDKTKRLFMGKAAAKKADYIYLTDDETYTEDPKTIIDGVFEGIKKSKTTQKTKVIPERGEAIKQAINDAKPGDTVLITGLGHQTSRNMGGKLVPWSDKKIAEKILKAETET
jgi:UDP-N-acetylmuramoyl-L-alanyl-D-glutamate--2,6-diaminopimelate ligase